MRIGRQKIVGQWNPRQCGVGLSLHLQRQIVDLLDVQHGVVGEKSLAMAALWIFILVPPTPSAP